MYTRLCTQGCIRSDSAFGVWSCFSSSHDSQMRASGAGNGGGTSLHYRQWPTRKSSASCLRSILLHWPRGLSSRGRVLLQRNTTMIPLNWKLKLSLSLFGFLMPLNQQARNRVPVLAGVIAPDHQREIELLLHTEGKEDDVWIMGHPQFRQDDQWPIS